MGRKFTPFQIVVHYTGKKSQMEIQNYLDEFYIQQIKEHLVNSTLQTDQKEALLDRLAYDHAIKVLGTS